MATIQNMMDLIVKIGDASGGDIPGLNFNKITEGMAKKNPQFQDALSQAETKKEKDALMERFAIVAAPLVNEQIAIIKTAYAEIQDGIKIIKQNVSSAIASIAIPPALGPVGPNPAYALLEAKQKVGAWGLIVAGLMSTFLTLLNAAGKIEFVLPDVVLGLAEKIIDLQTLLGTIPV